MAVARNGITGVHTSVNAARKSACATSELGDGWSAARAGRGLLERVRHLQHAPLVAMTADNLQADRQAFGA